MTIDGLEDMLKIVRRNNELANEIERQASSLNLIPHFRYTERTYVLDVFDSAIASGIGD